MWILAKGSITSSQLSTAICSEQQDRQQFLKYLLKASIGEVLGDLWLEITQGPMDETFRAGSPNLVPGMSPP